MSTNEVARDNTDALDKPEADIDETPSISSVGVQYLENEDAAEGLLARLNRALSAATKSTREADPDAVTQATQVYNDVVSTYREAKAQKAELELREKMYSLEGQRQRAELELKRVESELEIRKQTAEIEMQQVELSRATHADSVRGTVLLLVVFALVLTPLIAMTSLSLLHRRSSVNTSLPSLVLPARS